MCRSKKEIDELPEDSCDVFKRNMIDRYIDRPNTAFLGGKYKMLDTFCYANFLAHYYILPNKYVSIYAKRDTMYFDRSFILIDLLTYMIHT